MRASFSNYSNSSGEREGRLSVIKTNISESSIRWGSHRERGRRRKGKVKEGVRGEASIYDLLLTSHIKSIRDLKRSRHAHAVTAGCLALVYRSLSLSLSRSSLPPSLSLSLCLMGCLEQLVTVDKSKQMLIS